jgi:hypothetical protein
MWPLRWLSFSICACPRVRAHTIASAGRKASRRLQQSRTGNARMKSSGSRRPRRRLRALLSHIASSNGPCASNNSPGEQSGQRPFVRIINDEGGSELAKFGRCAFEDLGAASTVDVGLLGQHKRVFYQELRPAPTGVALCCTDGVLRGDTIDQQVVSIPLGHASHVEESGSVECPARAFTDEAIELPRRFPFLSLGVVVLLIDSEDRILLTRRAGHMRTFPSAWVLPGGGVDANEQIAEAASRYCM